MIHRVRIGRSAADALVKQSQDGHVGAFVGDRFRDSTGWEIEFGNQKRFVHGTREQLRTCAMHLAGLQGRSKYGFIHHLSVAENALLEVAEGLK